MDSGLTYAKAQNLRPGIALSAAQIASLTTDIGWLQQEDVTLPDGTVTKALVPHVYAAVREGDLSTTGALLSGDSVNVNTAGDLTNSGTILGRRVVQLDANSINNLGGQMAAQDIALNAPKDINNLGGTVAAVSSLSALAGGDINLTSTTQSSAGKASSDSIMTNSSSGFLSSSTTVTKESQASATAQVNSLSGNNVSINANQDLVSVGAKFAAQDTLTVAGKNSQSFYAAQDTAQSNKSVESSSSMFGGAISTGNSSSTDTSAKAVAIASEMTSTKAINVQVGNSATFEGANLTAQQIAFVNTDPTKAGNLILKSQAAVAMANTG